jgi:hypothetical protein
MRVELPSKGLGSTQVMPQGGFDFTSQLAAGETINTASVSITPWWGVDPSPSSMLSGSPLISGNTVQQLFTGGVLGVIYEVTCTANTLLSAAPYQSLILRGYLAVVPDF